MNEITEEWLRLNHFYRPNHTEDWMQWASPYRSDADLGYHIDTSQFELWSHTVKINSKQDLLDLLRILSND